MDVVVSPGGSSNIPKNKENPIILNNGDIIIWMKQQIPVPWIFPYQFLSVQRQQFQN